MQGRRGENDDVTALGRWAVGPVQDYDLFRRFDTRFVYGADLEKYWADYSHIAHTCSLRSLIVSF